MESIKMDCVLQRFTCAIGDALFKSKADWYEHELSYILYCRRVSLLLKISDNTKFSLNSKIYRTYTDCNLFDDNFSHEIRLISKSQTLLSLPFIPTYFSNIKISNWINKVSRDKPARFLQFTNFEILTK